MKYSASTSPASWRPSAGGAAAAARCHLEEASLISRYIYTLFLCLPMFLHVETHFYFRPEAHDIDERCLPAEGYSMIEKI